MWRGVSAAISRKLMEIERRFETTSGDVWTKWKPQPSDDTNSPKYYKKGDSDPKSQNSFAAAATHVEREYVTDSQSEPDRPTTIPVPGDGDEIEYADIQASDAREIGRRIMVDNDDLLVETYEINGETYHIDDIAEAFKHDDSDSGVVRYAI